MQLGVERESRIAQAEPHCRLDRDCDGAISADDFAAAMTAVPASLEEAQAEALALARSWDDVSLQ